MIRSLQIWFGLIFIGTLTSLSYYCTADSAMAKLRNYGTFYSEQQVLDFLNKYRRFSYIDETLKEYKLLKLTDAEVQQLVKRWPFITIESFHKPLRTIAGAKLANRLGGRMIYLTEQSFKKYKVEDTAEVQARRGLYALLSYLTACKLRHVLEDSFAIVAGYWLDQTSFSIAKVFNKTLPPEESAIYEWPHDLLKPDLIFYLNSPQTNRNVTEEEKQNLITFKNRLATVFSRWKSPKVIELNSTVIYQSLVDDMIYHINKELKHKYWFKLQLKYYRY